MRVLVTGAAGRIGCAVVQRLRAAGGLEVLATDRVSSERVDFPLSIADLLDRDAGYPLLDGADAVVHLANHPSFKPPDAQMIFNENVCMNEHVFQAAADQGVKRIVFASSIQTIAGQPAVGRLDADDHPAYLPLDGDVPARARNPYALSKQVSEVMLEYITRRFDVTAVAIRFPYVCPEDSWRMNESQLAHVQGDGRYQIDLAFTFLLLSDAATLVEAILRAELSGYRVYQPAAARNRLELPPATVIERYMPDWRLRVPADRMTSLVDLSRITRETGWTPSL